MILLYLWIHFIWIVWLLKSYWKKKVYNYINFVLDSNISLINGNGMERDITRFNTSDISVVKQQILKLISTESNIKLLEELIFAQDSYSKTAFKLYFT